MPPDANSLGAVFSTQRGNATAWIPMIGLSPAGSRTLDVPNTPNTPNFFQSAQIQDIPFRHYLQRPDAGVAELNKGLRA